MRMRNGILSGLFALLMLVPLGLLVHYNRAPKAPEALRLIVDDKPVAVAHPFIWRTAGCSSRHRWWNPWGFLCRRGRRRAPGPAGEIRDCGLRG